MAERGETERLINLLDAMEPGERELWLRMTNCLNQTPRDVAGNYETRKLLRWSANQEGVYHMANQPHVLIMYSTIDRDRAENEPECLRAAFLKYLDGDHVSMDADVSKKGMLRKIEDLVQKEPSGLIVAVISHGKDGFIQVGEDKDSADKVSIQEILNQMSGTKDKELLPGKPKVCFKCVSNKKRFA